MFRGLLDTRLLWSMCSRGKNEKKKDDNLKLAFDKQWNHSQTAVAARDEEGRGMNDNAMHGEGAFRIKSTCLYSF